MKFKALLNFLPIVAITTIVGSQIYQQWQQAQAARPNYDSPAAIEQPTGTVNGASEVNIPQTEVWQLVSVTDGDTLTVKRGNRQEKIRLCGIDAPEKAQPLGEQSRDYLRGLLSSEKVGIVPVERDRYGRLVAEVFALGGEEKFVQQELLTAGMAYVYPQYVGNCWNGAAMKMAESIGQEQKAGVWAGDYQRPWDYRKQKS